MADISSSDATRKQEPWERYALHLVRDVVSRTRCGDFTFEIVDDAEVSRGEIGLYAMGSSFFDPIQGGNSCHAVERVHPLDSLMDKASIVRALCDLACELASREARAAITCGGVQVWREWDVEVQG